MASASRNTRSNRSSAAGASASNLAGNDSVASPARPNPPPPADTLSPSRDNRRNWPFKIGRAPRDAAADKRRKLPQPPESWILCGSDAEYTAFIVKQLQNSDKDEIQKLISKATDVLRTITPLRIYEQSYANPMVLSITSEAPEFDTFNQQMALYHHIFSPDQETEECQQCANHTAKGPMEDCIVIGSKTMSGACTNCYYKALGNKCSIRKEAELAAKKAAREQQAEGSRRPGQNQPVVEFTQVHALQMSMAQLELAKALTIEELSARQEQMYKPSS